MTDTTQNVNDAAQVVVDAEQKALAALVQLIGGLFDGLTEISATLPNNITLDAARIISELKSQNGYRLNTELPAIIARYQPVSAPAAQAPISYSPEASLNG